MRSTKILLVLGAVPVLLGGCSALGLSPDAGSGATSATSPGPVSGAGWIVGATGSATPSAVPSYGTGPPRPTLPPVSFLPVDPAACTPDREIDGVDIPLTVVPAAGSFTVSWPRQRDSNYRITAVPQPLVSGTQPPYTWQDVPAGSGCTVTARITGLEAGVAYVIWLDAPNTGYERDGTRHPYSGRSGIVYPL